MEEELNRTNDLKIHNKDLVKRDISFDFCKAILIILVILGHFLQQCIKYSDGSTGSIYNSYYFIYSFHMPAFMFISGYFSFGKKADYKRVLRQTLLYLFLPMFLWDIVLMVYDTFLNSENFNIQKLSYSLWYIKALIFIRIITLPFQKNPSLLLALFLLSISLIAGQYYLMGILLPAYVIGLYFHKFNLLENKILIVGSIILFIVELVFIHPEIGVSKLDIIHNLNRASFLNFLNRLVLGISGTIAVLWLLRRISRYIHESFYRLGELTLGIYILQSILVERVFAKYFSYVGNIIIYVMLAILTAILCGVLLSYCNNQFRYSKYIFGK